MKNRKLLFFFSDDKTSCQAAVVPTLTALAERHGMDFESYICSRPDSWQGKVLPTVGHGHLESFYYLANFYDEILYCSLTDFASFQFRRAVLAFGGKVVSERKPGGIAAFYRDVFAAFGEALPEKLLILPDDSENTLKLAPYCYLDVIRTGALGLTKNVFESAKGELVGEKTGLLSLFCEVPGAEAIDRIEPGDTYASVTKRFAARNLPIAKQIGFIDPNCLVRWQTSFSRGRVLALYEDMEWEAFLPFVKECADRVGNNTIVGTQVVWNPGSKMVRNNDAIIAALAGYNLIHDLVGVNPRIGFTIQTEKKLPLDWMADERAPTPWDGEYSDEFLIEKRKEGAVPVCFVFYAADLGHLPVLPHFIDMMALDGMRAGVAFPSTWYQYQPELIEQLYIPLEQGGVCPNLEPMLSSVGVAVATEAEGFIKPDFLSELVAKARRDIAGAVGESRVPRGYYPFQDAAPFYRAGTGRPQFDVMAKLGFEYCITYKNCENRGSVEYESNGMTALNQQIKQWFPCAGEPTEVIRKWEADIAARRAAGDRKLDWIALGFDTPFFALTPNYLGEIEFERMRLGWAKHAGMQTIYFAMQYVRRTGGADGKLFLVKPHELYRYVKLAEKEDESLVERNI